MINHTYDNIESLNSIPEHLFPLYYTPFIKGLAFDIQKGHLFLSFNRQRINNAKLIELLADVRVHSYMNKYIIQGVLKSKSVPDSVLLNNILSAYDDIPDDIEVHLTEVTKEGHIEGMLRASRDANMWVIGHESNNKNIIYHTQSIARSSDALKKLVSPLLYNESISGISIHKPLGKYTPGYDMLNFDTININCTKNVTATILDVEDKIEFLRPNSAGSILLSKIKLQYPNGVVTEIGVEDLSFEDRYIMSRNKGCLINAPIELEVNELPLRNEPVIKRIISIA